MHDWEQMGVHYNESIVIKRESEKFGKRRMKDKHLIRVVFVLFCISYYIAKQWKSYIIFWNSCKKLDLLDLQTVPTVFLFFLTNSFWYKEVYLLEYYANSPYLFGLNKICTRSLGTGTLVFVHSFFDVSCYFQMFHLNCFRL